MRLSWNLGRAFGIDLYLHPSALLMYFVIQASGMTSTVMETIAIVVALFGSVMLHELGHALMARRYGIGTADITLYLFGGVARLERMPRSSGPELLIALAGPAVNFAIVLGLWTFLLIGEQLAITAPELLEKVLMVNLGLGIFNLLPVFPMDGGRVAPGVAERPPGPAPGHRGCRVSRADSGDQRRGVLPVHRAISVDDPGHLRVHGRVDGASPGSSRRPTRSTNRRFCRRAATASRIHMGRPGRRRLAARSDPGQRWPA